MAAQERIDNYGKTQQSDEARVRERIANYQQQLADEARVRERIANYQQQLADEAQAQERRAWRSEVLDTYPMHQALDILSGGSGSFSRRMQNNDAQLRQLGRTAEVDRLQKAYDAAGQAITEQEKKNEEQKRQTYADYALSGNYYNGFGPWQAQIDEGKKQLEDLKAKQAEAWQALANAKNAMWAGYMEMPDYAEKSKYVSTANGTVPQRNILTGEYTSSAFDNAIYDYINGNEAAQGEVQLMPVGTRQYGNWWGLDKNVVGIFNYIYATQGKDAAYKFMDEAVGRDYTGLEAAALGFAQGAGTLSLGTAIGTIAGGEGAQRAKDVYNQITRETQESAAQHPALAGAGRIAGSISLMYGIGSAAGTIAAKAGLPYILERTAVGALSFGGANAVQNAGAVSAGQMSIEDYLEGVGIGLAAGGAGSAAGAFASSGVAALLEKYGLMTSFGEFIRQMSGGVTESSVNTATEYVLRGEAPTKEELFETLVITFGFSLLTSATKTLETTAAQKANMEEAVRVLNEGYARLLNDANGMTPEGVAQQAGRILNQIESTRSALKGTYIAGQQESVNNIYAALDILEDAMKGYLNGYAGSSYTPDGVTGGSGGYGMTVRPAQNGAGGTQGASGTPTGTSIAAAASAAQRSAGGTQNGSDIAPAAQAPAAAVSPGQQNAAPGLGAADAGGIQANSQANNSANNLANAGAGGALRESTNVNDNPAQHTEAEQRVIEEYKNAVDPGLVEFYEAAKTDQKAGSFRLNDVTQRAAADINRLTGQNVDGFKTTIDARQAWHINNDHGENGKADHSMADSTDVARIQYVLDNYDSVENGGTTDAYWETKANGKNRRAPVVVFSKKVNGTYYVVEATPVTKAKSVYVVSAYMLEQGKTPPGRTGKKATEATSQLPDANAPWFTANTDSANVTSAATTIPQTTPAVNTLENTRDGENGWGTQYNSAAEALEAGMRELAPSLWQEYSGAEYTPQRDAIVGAVVRVGQDVGRGKVSPADALRYLERAYKGGGIEAIERIAATPGEKYAPRAGETVTLPTAEQELAERNGGNLNGQKRTEQDTGGQERTGADAGGQEAGVPLHSGDAGRGPADADGGRAEGIRTVRGGTKENRALTLKRQQAAAEQPLVSSAELGIDGGTDGKTLRRLPESDWDEEITALANWAGEKGVKDVQVVLGLLEVDSGAGSVSVFDVMNKSTGQLIIRGDALSRSISEIGTHAVAHYMADEASVRSFMQSVMSGKESAWRSTFETYRRKWAALTDSYAGFTEAEIELYVWEEIMGDAYANVNNYGTRASTWHSQALTALDGAAAQTAAKPGGIDRGAQTSEATERKTGPPERYLYAGERAQGADLDALKRAKEMQHEGVANDVIRRETGWYAGMDGKWRFEIDDSGMEFRRDGDARTVRTPKRRRHIELMNKAFAHEAYGWAELTAEEEAELKRWDEEHPKNGTGGIRLLGDYVLHDKLFEEYPLLRYMELDFEDLGADAEGYYDEKNGRIVLNVNTVDFGAEETLIHEIQHVIQSTEGFSPGASPGYWKFKNRDGQGYRSDKRYSEAEKRARDAFNAMPEDVQNTVRQIDRAESDGDFDEVLRLKDDIYDGPYANLYSAYLGAGFELDSIRRYYKRASGEELYANTAGEIEAFDVENRMDLDAEERRERMPELGDENTVFADGGGESYSIRRTESIPYQEQIDAFYNGNEKTLGRSDDIFVSEQNNGLKELGLGSKPFFLLKRNLDKMTRTEGANPKYSAHGLSESVIRRLPEIIKSPALVIAGNGRISIISDVTVDTQKEKNAPLLIGIDPNSRVDGKDAYEIKTAYGRDNFASWLRLRAGDSVILAGDKNKATALLRNVGIQTAEPVAYADDLTGEILPQLQGNVKQKYSTTNEWHNDEVISDLARITGADRSDVDALREVARMADDGSEAGIYTYAGLLRSPRLMQGIIDGRSKTQTGAFAKWFGNSAATNEAGEPLLLFHGAGARFTVFNTDGKPIWLSPNPAYADGYAGTTSGMERLLPGAGIYAGNEKRLIPAYASIQNPADIGSTDGAFTDGYARLGRQLGISPTELEKVWRQAESPEKMWQAVNTPEMTELLKKYGYDGIRAVENGVNTWGAFESAQVKSAVSNRGGFSAGNPDIRYSAADDEGRPQFSGELRLPGGETQSDIKYGDVDEYVAGSQRRADAARAERLRNIPKEEFTGTPALEKLGVKIENSVGMYEFIESMKANAKAARRVRRATRQAEERLGATAKEKSFANSIAAGLYGEEDIPPTMNAGKIMELADYYWAEQSVATDSLRRRRSDINQAIEEKMSELFTADAEFKQSSMLTMNYRTPERNMLHMFGDKRGKAINAAIFDPVAVNEAERIRFTNRMFDEVRAFTDSSGKKSGLTKAERAIVQQVIEGKAVGEEVASMEMHAAVENAAKNIRKGGDATDAAREFGLNAKEQQLAVRYARWLETQEMLESGNVDKVKVENAVEKYSQLFNDFYDAINDFLVAHGYEPIGFIKGYAPHIQPEGNQNLLNKTLQALGVTTDVTQLPSSIAGLTAEFKPNKRWNPYFLQRTTDITQYDIASAFESYVEYMSDVLYHTDDIMRVRQASQYLRRAYAPEEIRSNLEWAHELKYATAEQQEEFLRGVGEIDRASILSEAEVRSRLDKYIEEQLSRIEDKTKYSGLTMYLDNYANILAGKQSMADRGLEYMGGRRALNIAGRLTRAFAQANVAGNLSSALNQSAQLPQIFAELGPRWTAAAIRDIVSGRLRRAAWAQRSDFLTGKRGVDYIVTDAGEMITSALFFPAEFADSLVSTIAVRGRYLQEISRGRSEKEAMKAADAFGKSVMGSRAKGSKPLAFSSKTPVSRMLNMFQIEAFNSWEHMSQDLPREFREIAEEKGKSKAALALAAVIVKMLLSAFLLNRAAEETYGGTPAPFDIFGLGANFIASGSGLTTNEYLKTVIDNGWEKITGERLFDTDAEQLGAEPFDWGSALEDTAYNVSNDIPFLRNASGLLGLGDETLPMPDIYGGVSDIASAIKSSGVISPETGQAALGLASELMPGGRQLKKTLLGTVAAVQGGDYSGFGENERLKYPLEDSWQSAVKAILFGKNATNEAGEYYASGNKPLSAKQTSLYNDLIASGADRKTAYNAIQRFRAIDNNEDLTSEERGAQERELLRGLDLTDYQKLTAYRELTRAFDRADKFREIMNAGLSFNRVMDIYDEYAMLAADEAMTASEQSTEFAAWLDGQSLTAKQAQTVKEQLKFWSIIPAEASTYEKLTEAGVGAAKAREITNAIAALEPEEGKKTVSDKQKWRAAVDAGGTTEDQMNALKAVMTESHYGKLEIALSYGIEPESYVHLKEIMPDYDADGTGSLSGDELKKAIDSMGGNDLPSVGSLTREQQAVLWQLYSTAKSASNNPYNIAVGRKVLEEKNKKKEEEKNRKEEG